MPDRRASAMLDCQDGAKEGDANCKHCQASGDRQLYWGIHLDRDLLETIVGIYPEWFKDCDMSAPHGEPIPLARDAPTHTTPRQRPIDKNKESLKVKLMLRRPINQLVDQGILPSLKSPPAFHEQRQKLERAKMGDFLKHKIQKRPDRQELIQQHILEDTSVDPSLQDKQRQLKRARLADGLNDRISQRPGPLELVKVNILQADEILAQAVRGSLPFKNTCETPSPNMRISLDDDSGSDGVFSPSPPYDFSEHSQGSSLPSLEASEPSPNPNQGSPCSARTSFSMSPPSSVSSPMSVLPAVVSPQSQEQMSEFLIGGLHHLQHGGRGEMSLKNRKKTKPKTQPKARTIKFHEYKGPPNAQKNVASTAASAMTESSYDLLLQQQQLFLQWQLEWQQKYPQVVLQAAQKTNRDQIGQVNQTTSSTCSQLFESPASPQKLLSKLEDLKVSDLKAELKKRNLPVSGSKPLLIERLKSYSEHPQNTSNNHHLLTTNTSSSNCPTTSNTALLLDSLPAFDEQDDDDMPPLSPIKVEVSSANDIDASDAYGGILTLQQDCGVVSDVSIDLDMSVSCQDMGISDIGDSGSFSNEDIVQLQQRCIEKLQKELEMSQMQLHRTIISHKPQVAASIATTEATPTKPIAAVTYSNTAATNTATTTKPTAATLSSEGSEVEVVESKATQRQILHQYIQQRLQQQQLQIQKQKLAQESLKQQQKSTLVSTSSSTSTNANSTLTALLESRPMNAPINLNLPSMTSTTKAVSSFPSAVMTSQVFESKREVDGQLKSYPGVKPIQDEVVKRAAIPNGIANNRTSSLPSFSALIPNKPTPTRSNTDPQFLLTRPPPDYNEATRQLSKVKQNHLNPNAIESERRQNKKHKSSVKCQAVDDVLEILIKNGELPPSAAQEPPTPTTPTTPIKNDLTTHSIFPTSLASTEDSIFSSNNNTSIITTSILSTPPPPHLKDTSDLHVTSLQSVLELTPPSSAGFGDVTTPQGHVPPLDFEFHLDMEDIEAMDLEELDSGNPVSNGSDPTLPIHYASKEANKVDGGYHSGELVTSNEISDIHDRVVERSMDMDLFEWLEVQEEPSGISSSSSNFHHPSYSINDNDPLFANIANGHEALDLFPNDEMDFKSGHCMNLLQWDKADFAT